MTVFVSIDEMTLVTRNRENISGSSRSSQNKFSTTHYSIIIMLVFPRKDGSVRRNKMIHQYLDIN